MRKDDEKSDSKDHLKMQWKSYSMKSDTVTLTLWIEKHLHRMNDRHIFDYLFSFNGI